MSFNSFEYATVFMEELDSQLLDQSTTGWMEENAGQVQYNGGAEVKIPKMQMSGLGNYDRDGGFAKGAVTVTYETRRLTQDRGRTFQLDAMDVDEMNFAPTAGAVMREFQNTKVIPEIDAYRYSKIAELAQAAGKARAYTVEVETIFENLLQDMTAVRDTVGDGDCDEREGGRQAGFGEGRQPYSGKRHIPTGERGAEGKGTGRLSHYSRTFCEIPDKIYISGRRGKGRGRLCGGSGCEGQ